MKKKGPRKKWSMGSKKRFWGKISRAFRRSTMGTGS